MKNLMAVSPFEYSQGLRDSLVDYNLCYDSGKLRDFRSTLSSDAPVRLFHTQIEDCMISLVSHVMRLFYAEALE